MNYQRIYDEIIENRKQNIPECYSERHHIIPKSLGGTNDKDNIVRLTAREHFICHLLLTKLYKEGTPKWCKMINAFCRMLKSMNAQQDRYCPSKWYAYCRENLSKAMRICQTGSGNSQYGKHWIINPKTEEKKCVKPEEIQTYLNIGWIMGRAIKKPRNTNRSKKEKLNERYYFFTNKVTGKIKLVPVSRIPQLDSAWESPYYILDNKKQYIRTRLLDGISLVQIAKELNIGYWNVQSWYKQYAKDIKADLKEQYNVNKTRTCKHCGKQFFHKNKRSFCSRECRLAHDRDKIWVRKQDTLTHITSKEFDDYITNGWKQVTPIPGKPSSEWK